MGSDDDGFEDFDEDSDEVCPLQVVNHCFGLIIYDRRTNPMTNPRPRAAVERAAEATAKMWIRLSASSSKLRFAFISLIICCSCLSYFSLVLPIK